MGTPSPELKQLWIRVLKRVHPDLAVDEQDRIRCERLTQLANEAYQAGNIEALREVLSPSPNITSKRSLSSWLWLTNGIAFSSRQLLPIAIAIAILLWRGFFYSVTTSLHAVTNSPTAQVDSVEAPIQAHVEVPDAGIWQPHPSSPHGGAVPNQISTVVDPTLGASPEGSSTSISLFRTSDPSFTLQDRQQIPLNTAPPTENSVEPSDLYLKQMRERLYQSFSNYEHVDANVPLGNSSETWFDVNRDGSVSNVRVGKASGWVSLDYACVRAVQRAETVGALPEDYKLRTLPATFPCTYTGSNALQASTSIDSAADRSNVYVGSVRNTAHE